jgi:hypothetical protein
VLRVASSGKVHDAKRRAKRRCKLALQPETGKRTVSGARDTETLMGGPFRHVIARGVSAIASP